MREKAAWALFRIRDPETMPAILAALRKETDKELRQGYIYALAALGERSAPAIEQLLDTKDAELRNLAIRVLAGASPLVWPMPWPEPRPFP